MLDVLPLIWLAQQPAHCHGVLAQQDMPSCDSRLESDLSSCTVGAALQLTILPRSTSLKPHWLAELTSLPKAAGRTLAYPQLTSLLHGFSQLTLYACSCPPWKSCS